MSKILVLDIETTGFQKDNGKIVEVGIVELNLDNGNRRIIFDEVVYEKGITAQEVENAWIVQNSTLTVDMIRNGWDLERVRPEIQSILNRYKVGATAFNNTFDFGFLDSRGFVFPKKLPCPMRLSTDICQLKGNYGTFKFPKVQEAYDFFFGKTEYVELHRGADDAYHEAEIVYELYKRGIFKID